MAQFIDSSKFRFNGIHSDMFGLSIVTTDSNNTERIFGVNKTIEKQNGIGDNFLYVGEKRNTYNFEVEIMKLNQWNNVLPMTTKEYDRIIGWLMGGRDKIDKLEIDGLIHYGKFISGTEFHNPYRQGIIKLEFESITAYAYTPIMTSDIRVSGEKIIELENKSNLNDKVYLDIDIEKTRASGIEGGAVDGDVEIINLKNGKRFKVNNIEFGEVIRILGNGALEVMSLTNPARNMFKDSEYDSFPYIDYGVNRIKIIGDCRVKIQYQSPVALR